MKNVKPKKKLNYPNWIKINMLLPKENGHKKLKKNNLNKR